MVTTERMALLRWVIFQVLIGNVDGHAKNLSFFLSARGLALAPAYDMVCGLVYTQQGFEDTFAMAIGDGFAPHAVTPHDWALFAIDCGIAPGVVCREINRLARACRERLPFVARIAREEGGSSAMIERVCGVIERQTANALGAAPLISRAPREELPRATA
jgi:serine/threonine-protein kinase HipA